MRLQWFYLLLCSRTAAYFTAGFAVLTCYGAVIYYTAALLGDFGSGRRLAGCAWQECTALCMFANMSFVLHAADVACC